MSEANSASTDKFEAALPAANEILDMWEADSEVDFLRLGSEIARGGKLYSKYLELYMKWRVVKVKRRHEAELVEKDAQEWFQGRQSSPSGKYYPHKLSASEVGIYKKGDATFQKAQTKLESAEITVDVLTRILDQIKQRSFDLRAVADLRKAENGM